MFRIAKKFSFAASHVLDGLPDDHPCSRLHGHNYEVELRLRADEVDPVGFVLDYRALDRFKRYLDATLDHRHLNDVYDFNPTAELLASHLFRVAREMFWNDAIVESVAVSETPKTWAEYYA